MALMNQDTYVRSCDRCPRCQSDNTTAHAMMAEGNQAWREVNCHACVFKWNELFAVVGYEPVTIEHLTAVSEADEIAENLKYRYWDTLGEYKFPSEVGIRNFVCNELRSDESFNTIDAVVEIVVEWAFKKAKEG